MSPYRSPSTAWRYFTKCSHSHNLAVCNLCGREIKTSGNTTNLRNHLKVHVRRDENVLQNCGSWVRDPLIENDIPEDVKPIIHEQCAEPVDTGPPLLPPPDTSQEEYYLEQSPSVNHAPDSFNDSGMPGYKYHSPPERPPLPPRKWKIPETISNEALEANEIVAFGNSVVAQMARLPEQYAVQLMLDIQALIAKARLKYITDQRMMMGQSPGSTVTL